MPSQTAIVGTGANDAGIGSAAWTSPGNITANDANRATRALAQNVISNYLKGTNCGFTIPDGATVDDIVVEIERFDNVAGASCRDHRVSLVKADGSIHATNKADLGSEWPEGAGAEAVASYTWTSAEHGLTRADVNDADFGAVVAATNSSATSGSARVDFIRITVNYTAGTAHTKNLDDSVAPADAFGKAAAHPVADSAAAADAVVKAAGSHQADSAAVSETRVAALGKAIGDAVTPVDAVQTAAGYVLGVNDSVVLGELVAKGVARPLADSAAAADGVVKSPGLVKAESVGLADLLGHVWAAHLVLGDPVAIADGLDESHTQPEPLPAIPGGRGAAVRQGEGIAPTPGHVTRPYTGRAR